MGAEQQTAESLVNQQTAESLVRQAISYLAPKFNVSENSIPFPVVQPGKTGSYGKSGTIILPVGAFNTEYVCGEETGHHIHRKVNPSVMESTFDNNPEFVDFMKMRNLIELVGCYAGLAYAKFRGEETGLMRAEFKVVYHMLFDKNKNSALSNKSSADALKELPFYNKDIVQHVFGNYFAARVFEELGDSLLPDLARAKSLEDAMTLVEKAGIDCSK